MSRAELHLTDAERDRMMAYVNANLGQRTRGDWEFSYPKWALGGSAWGVLQEGGTGIMKVLMWYHHVHKNMSAEWRPSVIIRALRDASGVRP